MGILKLPALRKSLSTRNANGKALALLFDWYSEYSNKPKSDRVKEIIPNFNPIGQI